MKKQDKPVKKRFKIAVVQLDFGSKDLLGDIKGYIHRAKASGVSIVCFPEHALYSSPKKNAQIVAEVGKECKKHNIWCIIVGRMEERKQVYNSAILINGEGKISGRHKKVHICDTGVHKGGTSFEVYDTPFCKIGLAICWDISHPKALYTMAKKGAKVIFCPMYWLYDNWAHKKNHKAYEKRLLRALLLARAFENLTYVAFANAYHAKLPDLVPYTAIAEPHMVLKELFDKGGMVVAEVDLEYLERIRRRYAREYKKVVSA